MGNQCSENDIFRCGIPRDYAEFEGVSDTVLDLSQFWNYNQNKMYTEAENITTFFYRIYDFLDEIKEKYKDKKVLVVAHLGVSIAVNCYFNGIPYDDTLLLLGINNCEVVRYKDCK